MSPEIMLALAYGNFFIFLSNTIINMIYFLRRPMKSWMWLKLCYSFVCLMMTFIYALTLWDGAVPLYILRIAIMSLGVTILGSSITSFARMHSCQNKSKTS
jgi:hypothetical protein